MKSRYLFIGFFCLFFSLQAAHYRILVLPCGGATSIMNAIELEYIEQQIGMPTAHIFDEIWGASAGSIIATFLTTPSCKHKDATGIIQFFEQTFSSYHNAYFIREAVQQAVGQHALIQESPIGLRILTAASPHTDGPFIPYDFSSDGKGTCAYTNIPVATITKASCTVYPYLYRTPIEIALDHHIMHCIDPGSLSCQPSMSDPTAHFLKQLLPRLAPDDTLTIFFLGNLFIRSLDYENVVKVLEEFGNSHSWAIRYFDGTFNPERRTAIEIVNIPVTSSRTTLIKHYLKHATTAERVSCKMIEAILERIVGKRNAAPNLLAMGVVPLSFLKKEAHKVISTSKNFLGLIEMVRDKSF